MKPIIHWRLTGSRVNSFVFETLILDTKNNQSSDIQEYE